MGRNGLASNQIRPTEKQIESNIIVIPRAFVGANPGLNWKDAFHVVFLGSPVGIRRLDSERRISIPLRSRVTTGAILTLAAAADELRISVS